VSRRKRAHDTGGGGAAVKGARRAFILTLDSGLAVTIFLGTKRSFVHRGVFVLFFPSRRRHQDSGLYNQTALVSSTNHLCDHGLRP